MLLQTARRPARPPTAQNVYVAPPLGGLNTVSPAGEMPATDATMLQNLIPAELGLRARLGNSEWCTGIDSSGPVLTVLPFNGSQSSKDRLFAVTKNGIWDVTSSTATPSQVYTFASTANSSGIGAWHTMVTSAGHFLMYCDEENGYHLYVESLDAWQAVVSSTQTAWQNSHAYTLGTYATNDSGKVYKVVTAGTSAGSGGPTGTGTAIADGSVVWNFNFSVSGVDPANFAHVAAFKNRAWFTQKNTANAWYLDLQAIAGAATKFPFGGQFRAGGYLVGVWNWTGTDGGEGLDDRLVGLSSGGDLVIYEGIDPNWTNTFGLAGVWTVGALPSGRAVVTEFGGDLLIASLMGAIRLSTILSGANVNDPSQYATAKVQNLYNLYTGLYGSNSGWALRLDPKDNALLVLVPVVSGQPNVQLAMSLATKGWFPYSGLAMSCAAPWNGTLYFGTTTGTVCKHDGYVDGVTLAAPTASVPIQWNYLGAFNNLGTPNKKRVNLIRPKVLSAGGVPPYQPLARFDFDLSYISPVAGAVAPAGNAWDSAIWDTATWGGDYQVNQQVFGATGMGSHIAVGVAGLAASRTIVAGVDVSLEVATGFA